MKILVCVSCVPDTTSKVSFTEDNKFNKENIQFIIGPYEDYALARAVELKEKNSEIDISLLNVGLSENDPLLRKGLAIGADRAYRINSEPIDSNFVAHNIASFINKNNFDLILMGKESIDYNSGLVHYLSGSILNIQTFNPVTYLDLENDKSVIIKRETDSGIEKIKAKLPLILGCQEPIAEWKIPNMRGIMNARSKELSVIEPIGVKAFLKLDKYMLPPEKEEIITLPQDSDLKEEFYRDLTQWQALSSEVEEHCNLRGNPYPCVHISDPTKSLLYWVHKNLSFCQNESSLCKAPPENYRTVTNWAPNKHDSSLKLSFQDLYQSTVGVIAYHPIQKYPDPPLLRWYGEAYYSKESIDKNPGVKSQQNSIPGNCSVTDPTGVNFVYLGWQHKNNQNTVSTPTNLVISRYSLRIQQTDSFLFPWGSMFDYDPGRLQMLICRVDGTNLKPLISSWGNRDQVLDKSYAVLQMSETCPAGSRSIVRNFHGQPSPKYGGAVITAKTPIEYAPNQTGTSGLNLSFCVFTAGNYEYTTATSLPILKTVGQNKKLGKFGVFSIGNLPGKTEEGYLYIDDYNDNQTGFSGGALTLDKNITTSPTTTEGKILNMFSKGIFDLKHSDSRLNIVVIDQ